MKITFTGIPAEPEVEELSMFGYTFPKDKPVDVTDLHAQVTLAGHPFFKGAHSKGESLVLPQTIPSVENTLLVSDGHHATTLSEVAAINNDPRMLPGYQASAEEVLKAKADANGDDYRVGETGPAETDGAGTRRARGRARS